MSVQYNPVSQSNTSFGNPRQKTWCVFHQNGVWNPGLITNSFSEAQDYAKGIIAAGGVFSGLDHIMVVEIVPNDIVMAPTV